MAKKDGKGGERFAAEHFGKTKPWPSTKKNLEMLDCQRKDGTRCVTRSQKQQKVE